MADQVSALQQLARGLTSIEAAQRLQQFGRNEIQRQQAQSPWLLFAAQFRSPVVWLLFGACVVSAALGEVADACRPRRRRQRRCKSGWRA